MDAKRASTTRASTAALDPIAGQRFFDGQRRALGHPAGPKKQLTIDSLQLTVSEQSPEGRGGICHRGTETQRRKTLGGSRLAWRPVTYLLAFRRTILHYDCEYLPDCATGAAAILLR
jgi:hypothetical protein